MAERIVIGEPGTEIITRKSIISVLFQNNKPMSVDKICRQRGWKDCRDFVGRQADYLARKPYVEDNRVIIKSPDGKYSFQEVF
jgi:predicted Zn-ribbon and HTH transcriptional regulator